MKNLKLPKYKLKLVINRQDGMPGFAAFLRHSKPGRRKLYRIYLNVEGCLHPFLYDIKGKKAINQTRRERKMMMITSLMHEFGHALEQHFRMPVNERAIEKACEDFEG